MQQLRTIDFGAKFIYKHYHLKKLKKDNHTKLFIQKSTEYGKWTKKYMASLGPTFIKLGQVLSTRNDILSQEFIKEIESLQDDVTPLPFDDLHYQHHPNIF